MLRTTIEYGQIYLSFYLSSCQLSICFTLYLLLVLSGEKQFFFIPCIIPETTILLFGGHNLDNVRYNDDIVLRANTERKPQKLLQNAAKESEKKGIKIN